MFLKKLLEFSAEDTKPKDYAELSENRGISVGSLKHYGFVKNFLTDEWLVPVINANGKLANVHRCTQNDKGGWIVMSSPSCKLHPIGLQNVRGCARIHVVEGVWDLPAMWDMLQETGMKKDGSFTAAKTSPMSKYQDVIAAPGAGNFQIQWLDHIENKFVYLWFDNDHPRLTKANTTVQPGWDGAMRIKRLCVEQGKTPKAFHVLRWGNDGYDAERTNGFDVRDLLRNYGPVGAVTEGMRLMTQIKLRVKRQNKELEQQQLEPIARESFKELLQDFRDNIHMTKQLQDTITLMFSTMISTTLDGDQVWLRVIGPPGSGKTTIAECLSAHPDYAFPVSIQTGFHSGYRSNNKDGDNSLIPKMNNKTTIIKDADTLNSAPSRDRILAELRDLYDGTSRAIYRTGLENMYDNLRATLILCGTDELRDLNRAALGERFLDCEIIRGENTRPYLERSVRNTVERVSSGFKQPEKSEEEEHVKALDRTRMNFLKRVTMGALEHYKKNMLNVVAPQFPINAEERVIALAELLSYVRASVKREGTDVVYRPRPELATRLSAQFTKLSISAAYVLDKEEVDDEVVELIKKIFSDTSEGFRYEIMCHLYKMKQHDGATHAEIERLIGISEGSVRKQIKDMRELKIITKTSQNNRSGQRGRNAHFFRLSPSIRALMALALEGKKLKVVSGKKPVKKVVRKKVVK